MDKKTQDISAFAASIFILFEKSVYCESLKVREVHTKSLDYPFKVIK